MKEPHPSSKGDHATNSLGEEVVGTQVASSICRRWKQPQMFSVIYPESVTTFHQVGNSIVLGPDPNFSITPLGQIKYLHPRGMSVFLKHVAVLGIAVDNIFNASLAWKKELHSAIKEGIKLGIVQPLGNVLFTEQQTFEALSSINLALAANARRSACSCLAVSVRVLTVSRDAQAASPDKALNV
ncbi:unnamed protein product [Timema podura]|uniref:Uncharacterized protein n=1 Tax=Timema podura TaxID=61482 RepID=A0ABN7NIG5_TIMPD|nr:unnamed protein product [Timema podura]